MKAARKINKLKYDSWNRYTEWQGNSYRILPSFLHQKLEGRQKDIIYNKIHSNDCPVCLTPLEHVSYADTQDATGTRELYKACTNCGFWKFHLSDNAYLPYYSIPHIKRFDYERETPSIVHLSNELKKDNKSIYHMHPSKFEKYVGSVLADFYDCEVYHVGQSGDDGIDLIAIVGDNPLLVQVKRRESEGKTEGINIVKLLFASAFARGINNGMIVTTASRFSKPAQKWLESPRIKELGFKMELRNFNDLMSMVDAVMKDNENSPWEVFKNRQRGHLGRRWTKQDWKVHHLTDGDIASTLIDGQLSLVAFNHADLTKCSVFNGPDTFMKGVNSNLSYADFENLLPGDSLKFVKEEQAIYHVEGIPFFEMEQINQRWLKQFPNELFDFT